MTWPSSTTRIPASGPMPFLPNKALLALIVVMLEAVAILISRLLSHSVERL